MTVEELLHRISSKELSEWIAYARFEPFGEEAADKRAAMLLCLLANVNRDRQKHPEPFTVEQFRLHRDEAPEAPAGTRSAQQNLDDLSQEELVFMVELFNAAFGGKDLRK
jgi:hypothetical protein